MSIKLNWWDKTIGAFSQKALHNRLVYRQRNAILTRGYDGAIDYRTSQINRSPKSPNSELKKAISPLREGGRELFRNSAFARKGVGVLVNNSVGWGITPKISHADETTQQQIRQLWEVWSKSCSIDGSDFYTLQRLAMQSLIVDGEVLCREVITESSLKLQLLESDHIDSTVDEITDEKTGLQVIQGIIVNNYNQPVGYYLSNIHPGDGDITPEVITANQMIHLFDRERPGQLRGTSWLNPVIHSLKLLDNLQFTQLQRLQLAASLTAAITTESSTLPAEDLKAQREEDWALTPGTTKYLNPGEKIEFPSIPNPEGFAPSIKTALQQVAAGLGITYEALSGDLSNVSFSSARMGAIEQNRNIDRIQWTLFIPRFCDPAFEKFKKFCALKGVSTDGVSVHWNPPIRTMVNPKEEVATAKEAIRSGLQTLPGALRELGIDPETHLKEIAESNKMITDLGLVLDSDPRATANGQIQSAKNLEEVQDQLKNKPD